MLEGRKQLKLQQQVALLQTLANHANAVIGAKDLQGRYLFVNQEYSRLFQRPVEDFLGKTDFELFPPEIAQAFREADLQVIEQQQQITLDEQALVEGQTHHYVSVKFPIHDEQGTLFATGVVATDITKRKRKEAEIEHLAHSDSLTGLSNRAHFYQRFAALLEQAGQTDQQMGVMVIDVDRFKSVNDSMGHLAGDRLLEEVTRILRSVTRDSDVVARIGGDEFAILLPSPESRAHVSEVAQRIVQRIHSPMELKGNPYLPSISMGIAMYPEDGTDAETLMHHADLSLYQCKRAGRNRYAFFAGGSENL